MSSETKFFLPSLHTQISKLDGMMDPLFGLFKIPAKLKVLSMRAELHKGVFEYLKTFFFFHLGIRIEHLQVASLIKKKCSSLVDLVVRAKLYKIFWIVIRTKSFILCAFSRDLGYISCFCFHFFIFQRNLYCG